jgi:hypothetical protein
MLRPVSPCAKQWCPLLAALIINEPSTKACYGAMLGGFSHSKPARGWTDARYTGRGIGLDEKELHPLWGFRPLWGHFNYPVPLIPLVEAGVYSYGQ